MKLFPCDYLDSNVEMTEERARHIAERHPELLPEHEELIAETLAEPDLRFAEACNSSMQDCSPVGTLIFAEANTLLRLL